MRHPGKASGEPRQEPQLTRPRTIRQVPTYCYNCVSGPDFMTVRVEDGVATEVAPNFAAEGIHPAGGRVCVKAYGLVQKTYNPNRVLSPMKRSNPRKGRDEEPGFTPISWDEALDLIAEKVKATLARGALDESGMPRIAASFGHGGTPAMYMGTFPAFLSALGPIDFSFGSGQGVKCVHSEHLYGEFLHRAFTVAADTPSTRYVISLGANVESSGGPCAVTRHADARIRGYKRVQVEPHLSVTAACSAEWVPIRPKTDPAFMFALIHVLLIEHGERKLRRPWPRPGARQHVLGGALDRLGDTGLQIAQRRIDPGRGLLDAHLGADQRRMESMRHARPLPDVEVLQRALGLRTPIGTRRDLHAAHGVGLGAGGGVRGGGRRSTGGSIHTARMAAGAWVGKAGCAEEL